MAGAGIHHWVIRKLDSEQEEVVNEIFNDDKFKEIQQDVWGGWVIDKFRIYISHAKFLCFYDIKDPERICSFEELLDLVSPGLRCKLLFHLDIFSLAVCKGGW